MEISANAEKIISQADQWTFAVDCALLQWMEDIGKNLEQRATETNKRFDQLSTNLKQTGTALENVTNSLAALQYTQFVESRCHDDDETIANVTEVPLNVPNQNNQSKDSDDVWQTFLKNNLEALRSCHERYSLDLEDSDEEDATNNFIYQPKNPYNERLLPHIYGTKLWNENWHVGLCDDSNSFSGDDVSEAFSETSSSPAEDNDSFASNSANLAEWASTTSITNEIHHQQQAIRIQNASSLRGSQPLFPSVQDNLPNASSIAGSETSSPASITTPIGLKQNEARFDIFASVPDSPPPPPLSSSSSASSLQKKQLKNATQSKNNNLTESANLVTKPETINPTINSSSYISPIKRRPVNLFDDDDFSSFLTEIVDKSTSREAAISDNNTTTSTTGVRVEQKEQNKGHSSITPNTQPIIINSQTNKKPPTLNLFDNPDSSPKNENLFNKVQQVVEESREKNIVRPKLSTKTLFDDDDDDDFLAIFAAKKENIPKPVSKLKLFDDDIEDDILQSSSNLVVPPIDKITKMQAPNEEKGLFQNSESIKRKDSSTMKQNLFTEVTDKKYNFEEQKDENLFTKINQNPVNLFDNVNVHVDESANKSSTPALQKKTDLFSSEEDDDLFNTTFEQAGKISSKILEENVRDTKTINTELPQDQKQKQNIEPFENIPTKQPEIKQGTSGNEVPGYMASDDFLQKDKTIDKIREELVNENEETIESNKTELLEEVPTVLKQSSAPTDKQEIKNTFSDLFLDEPPDDDSAFLQTLDSNVLTGSSSTTNDFEQDNYEPALPAVPTADKPATQKVIPVAGLSSLTSYSNLGLFSDVPPDDDLEDSSIESANTSNNEPKRIHSIFYDDFNETMEALNNRKSLETNPSLHSIFYDEPPPDDDFQPLLENTVKYNEANNTSMDKIVDKIQAHETKQKSDKSNEPDETVITPPKSVIVSKLKMPNLNINVQALLPGATQKSQLRKSVEKDKELESTSIPAEDNTSPTIAPQTELKRDSAENILVNVCKHRVRAPPQRRPSTRRGRQENYRKSLISEQEDELNIEEENKQKNKAIAISKQSEDKELPKTTVQSIKEVTKDIPKTIQTISLASTLTPGVLKSVPSASTQSSVADFFDIDQEKNQELNVKNMQAAVTKNKLDVLFDDDDGDNDDYDFLFGDINKNKKIEESSKLKTASFLSQANEADFIAIQENHPSDNSQIQSIPNPTINDDNPITPGFEDMSKSNNKLNEIAVSRNKLFENIDNQAAFKETVSGAGGLFDDDDEDVDLLFANKMNSSGDIPIDSSNNNKQTKVDDNKSKKVQNSRSDIKIENKLDSIPTPAKSVRDAKEFDKKGPSLNIFGDDDDDDILFGSSTSKSQPQAVVKTSSSEVVAVVGQKVADFKKKSEENLNKLVTQPKVSSLFGSDEDDQNDDGKFLNAMKNSAKLKTRLTKAAEKEDSSKALFSDTDDDDEDLFGSKTAKATLPKSSQSNVTATTKKPLLQASKTTPSAATTTDNPLADLFND